MGMLLTHSVQQSLNIKPLVEMWLLSHGGRAADRGMGNQRF